ncbi:NADPH:quinone oxidoreductase family protein [Meridianimarinicoccus aquatilis]|uniref:NADPH:quinone oxidoreductase family protein n=1 Tax=Meridianimarinicoccus aquatilis TaxID=2552766 RepID=A0A4R6AX98_9RHOB|nr:NADPH:quinone oxidoreductase family protein [Fluviibacterium aquatile]TDL86966.1 NADPH:quinone oxidoreductase family protein [Fluviibacterium aquatile]
MRAFEISEFGTTPKLVTKETPEPQPGEVQVAIKACGLNHADLLMIEGRYQEKPPLPITLGMEIAGTITKLGANVDGLSVGDRVAAVPGSGGLADMACISAERCVPLPDSITDVEAAAFQIAYGTSHLALSHRADLRKGETLLVLGAAGGVGLTAVELGARLGARVIACARGADKLEVAKAAGAHDVLDSDAPDLRDRLKAMGGVDVVYDAVGDPLFTSSMKACKPGARILVIGFAAGQVPQIPANYLLVKNITVHGLYWGGYLGFDPKALTTSLSDLLNMHTAGDLHPHVSHTLALENAAEGLALLRDRKSTGKVVIVP